MARGPAAEGDIMSVKSLEQEAEYVARLEFTCRQQALVEQASRAAEAECQRVFTLVQQHCPTCGAPLVTVTYRSLVIDKCAPCQGVWLDCDEFLFFGEALERVLAKDHWLLGTLKRILT
jgi:TFIIB-like protein